MRLAVYTDYVYHRHEGEVFGERAFTLFLGRLAGSVDELTLLGRLDPGRRETRYPLGDHVRFVPLPYYSRLDRLREVTVALGGAVRRFWRLLSEVDCVWVLGPNPFAIAFALLALLRGKRVALGVRSEMLTYVASRHPGRPLLRILALALEGTFRLLGRRCPVVAVGPVIAGQYGGSRAVLEILVSLVEEADIAELPPAGDDAGPARADHRRDLTILSVGRLESEKNPLILADTLALLRAVDPRWRLVVCGEGPLAGPLTERLRSMGLEEAVDLRGYVPFDQGLRELYESSDMLLHISWTEGFPQVLLEAFAAGLPVVATDVGGIRAAAGGSIRLIPAGDPALAAAALEAVAGDEALRRRLTERGREFALRHTTEAEVERVAEFLRRA